MHCDVSGYAISVANNQARTAWDNAVEAILAHDALAPALLADTLAIDPGFALAHAATGLILLTLARADLLPTATDCLRSAEMARSARGTTPREELYLKALRHWLRDAPRSAAFMLEDVLTDHPLDALALKLSHTLRFMLGDQAQMLVPLQRVASAFDRSHPFAGFVQGCLAFALEERGFYSEAEEAGCKAVSLAPRDVWGRHAVAHVLEMTGRAEEGDVWLTDTRRWSHANNFRLHMIWHRALFKMERGELAEVLDLYDREIRGTDSDDYRDIANGASLLTRLQRAGLDPGPRWEELADRAERRAKDRRLVFAELHYLLAMLGAGRVENAEAIAECIVRDSKTHGSVERRTAARSGGITACALLAFHDADYARAAQLLSVARDDLLQIGGSHAQRDVFEQVYIESLIRSGNLERATAVLEERLLQRRGGNGFARAQLRRICKASFGAGARSLAALCNEHVASHADHQGPSELPAVGEGEGLRH